MTKYIEKKQDILYIKYIDNYQKMEIEKLIEYKKSKQKTQIKNTNKKYNQK